MTPIFYFTNRLRMTIYISMPNFRKIALQEIPETRSCTASCLLYNTAASIGHSKLSDAQPRTSRRLRCFADALQASGGPSMSRRPLPQPPRTFILYYYIQTLILLYCTPNKIIIPCTLQSVEYHRWNTNLSHIIYLFSYYLFKLTQLSHIIPIKF